MKKIISVFLIAVLLAQSVMADDYFKKNSIKWIKVSSLGKISGIKLSPIQLAVFRELDAKTLWQMYGIARVSGKDENAVYMKVANFSKIIASAPRANFSIKSPGVAAVISITQTASTWNAQGVGSIMGGINGSSASIISGQTISPDGFFVGEIIIGVIGGIIVVIGIGSAAGATGYAGGRAYYNAAKGSSKQFGANYTIPNYRGVGSGLGTIHIGVYGR